MAGSQAPHRLGLVLSGGGARGAYEAGVIHYIRTALPSSLTSRLKFDILCGSSVGAINTAFLASTAHDSLYQGTQLYQLWRDIKQENIYRRDVVSLVKILSKGFWGISRNLTSHNPARNHRRQHFSGLLMTKPLREFLQTHVSWKQIAQNIKSQDVSAVSVTATNLVSGKLELFIQKHPEVLYTGHYTFHETNLRVEHIMASSALPFIFETIAVEGQYYLDGGLRLNTPLSPAIQLGADRILAIGLHHQTERPEVPEKLEIPPALNYPSLGQMLGKVLSAVFLDKLDYDLEQMSRINRIIEWSENVYGKDYLERINGFLTEDGIRGDIASRGLKNIEAFPIYPSRDLREVFADCVPDSKFLDGSLSRLERTLLKILDVSFEQGRDFLSFILFHPKYLEALLELGYEDAKRQRDALMAFLESHIARNY